MLALLLPLPAPLWQVIKCSRLWSGCYYHNYNYRHNCNYDHDYKLLLYVIIVIFCIILFAPILLLSLHHFLTALSYSAIQLLAASIYI